LPARLVHGDLKISNLLFDDTHTRALALVDLDTLANLNIPVELGDAFRSWCNPAGEDAAGVSFRADLFAAGIEGYAAAARALLVPEEREALVLAIETIALELSCRFCSDALEESYFGWNPAKFASRSAHNRARAESQLALARSVNQQRAPLEATVRAAFSG
jgi:Ser/Thr protein kinase RdoA (MazF antagonist)